MKDMPEFYDHEEEEIEVEMKQLNKEWIRTKLPWGGRNTHRCYHRAKSKSYLC